MIVSETTVTDPGGRLLWMTKRSIFARGEGGFGGRRDRQHPSRRRIAARHRGAAADPAAAGAAVTAVRRPQSAALRPGIRCGGWLSACDPAWPVHLRHRVQGERRHFLDGDASRVHSYGARFAGVVFPGETLRAGIWKENDKLLATITAPGRDDAAVLSGVELTPV